MVKRKFKLYLLLVLVCLILSLLDQKNDNSLNLVVCDVGQGDAILIWDGSRQMLVDAGPDEKILECLEEYMPWWDRKIEIVVATHPDADHIGGLATVFRHYKVDLLVTNGDEKETTVFSELNSLIQRQKISLNRQLAVVSGQRLKLSRRIVADVLSPLVEASSDEAKNDQFTETSLSDTQHKNNEKLTSYNNRSISLFVRLDGVKILLMADVEKETELALIKRGLIHDVDILKNAHHGSKSSSKPQFLYWARPEISLLSLGENNRFGHPSPQVLENLAKISCQIYRTDQLGHLHIQTDGLYYWLVPSVANYFLMRSNTFSQHSN